jgi:hypothetical protein
MMMGESAMPTVIDPEVFVRQAEAIYNRKYRAEYEHRYHGQIVAIDVNSEEAFVGQTELAALNKARRKHPDHVFFFLRVGYKAALRVASPQYRTARS